MSTCSQQLANVTALYGNLSAAYDACGCGAYVTTTPNPCDNVVHDYDQSLHIVAIFVVLVGSIMGACFPLLVKYCNWTSLNFMTVLGKCMGTGVVLACGFVHMLQPSAQSLTSPCVPWEFNTDYNAYAFLYAMLAGLFLQFMDFCFLEYALARQNKQRMGKVTSTSAMIYEDGKSVEMKDPHVGHFEASGGGHAHSSYQLDGSTRKLIEAYMIEFGVTVHSVFIGLAVGVSDASTLKSLLVALIFHQLFEGVALGARIADAKFPSHLHEVLLTSIFCLAAPVGLAIGLGVWHTMDDNGETFLLVQGTFDGICGGVLIYIGYSLLLNDFPNDMNKYCRTGTDKDSWKKFGMFAALWLGAGLMAYIGKYL